MIFIGIQTHGMIGRNVFVYCVLLIVNRRPHGSSGSFMRNEIKRESDFFFDLCHSSMSNIKLDSLWTNLKATPFLPPANDVWGKVMILLASVILSTGGRGSLSGGVSLTEIPLDRDFPWKKTLLERDLHVRLRAGGTHPTGMHTCCFRFHSNINEPLQFVHTKRK